MTSVFYLFRDAPHRRAALALEPGSPARYSLFGMDELANRGYAVRHNLARQQPAAWARATGGILKRGLELAGGYGGDFGTVLASQRELNRADVVFSTVDTVGIPLMLLARARVVRPPFVYVAIGLPERLVQLRSARMERLYARALGSASSVVAYSEHEAGVLREWLGERGVDARVEFVPFGVDVEAFRPTGMPPDVDVVSIGGDPHRDFELLLTVARGMPETSFLAVTTADRARSLAGRPANVNVETDLPFDEMRRRLERARVVALPVRENSYSGATTVLLQAMALAKPVVVTRTAAIAAGYGLEDGANVRLVAPADAEGFGGAIADLLGDDARSGELGARARASVEAELSWDRYVDRLAAILRAGALSGMDDSTR
ncbi:glycosyltransferase family 4 protein [Gaiella sp.]|uniref:glycosyltransferase family 4 protein n=1 Tax=Gaiella sp. TaxID=2663207 RepID=UPI002E379D72|nr:glycosyltransferase family 4 protein [Gaiella sp.]HEX5582094.1 glycosyltransferase family 4 protein [Gaiella sp.]